MGWKSGKAGMKAEGITAEKMPASQPGRDDLFVGGRHC